MNIKKALLLLFVMSCSMLTCFSANITIISADNENSCPYSYIFQDTTALIIQDAITSFNQSGSFKAKKLVVQPKEQKKYQQLKNNYQSSGVINFKLLKGISEVAKNDFALLISSSVDIQNHLMDETIWFKLNIPGANVISPKYKIYTNVSLVDMHNEEIVWQNVYAYKIGADKFSIANPLSTPNYEQIKRLKTISQRTSEDIVMNSTRYIFVDQNKIQTVQNNPEVFVNDTTPKKAKKSKFHVYTQKYGEQFKNMNLIQ